MVVCVDGGWVDVLAPGAGAAAPPAAEPEEPEVLLDGLELVAAPEPLLAAAVAALSMPPWPLHAPRPP